MQLRHALAGTYPAALACIVRPGAYACDGTVLVLAATAGRAMVPGRSSVGARRLVAGCGAKPAPGVNSAAQSAKAEITT